MTKLLEKAVEMVRKLSADSQDAIARAMSDHDLSGLRAALLADFACNDHRRTGLGKLESADPRALQRASPQATDRLAATWYSGSPFTIDVNLTDGQTHAVSLYAVDWDTTTRAARRPSRSWTT